MVTTHKPKRIENLLELDEDDEDDNEVLHSRNSCRECRPSNQCETGADLPTTPQCIVNRIDTSRSPTLPHKEKQHGDYYGL
jgi:hypothetical protein